MNKITATLTIVIVLFASIMFGSLSVSNLVNANPISMPSVPAIQIGYPRTSIGGYVNSSVEFDINVNLFIDSPILNNVSYSLDGGAQVFVGDLRVTNFNDFGPEKIDFKSYVGNVKLKDLPEGNHTLAAFANGMSASSDFTVNSNYHVTALSVVSPTNQIYPKEVPLLFSFSGEIQNAHYYLYKGHETVSEKSLSGNMTLDRLPDGSYDLYVFVTTEFGQDSKAIHFTVISNSTQDELLLLGITVLLIIIGAFVYFKKRKNRFETRLPSILMKNI
jgi:LPXTG-motif cell wall-anchored protein